MSSGQALPSELQAWAEERVKLVCVCWRTSRSDDMCDGDRLYGLGVPGMRDIHGHPGCMPTRLFTFGWRVSRLIEELSTPSGPPMRSASSKRKRAQSTATAASCICSARGCPRHLQHMPGFRKLSQNMQWACAKSCCDAGGADHSRRDYHTLICQSSYVMQDQ